MPVSRSAMMRRLAEECFDILVIGGGVTGAGIAQDAAHRGLRTALVEKRDFAAGTTHASTKLLHGGLRYLEQGEFKLMYEALHERNRLTQLAPHVAEWLPFLIPIYDRGWKSIRIGIGLWLYDLLAGFPKGHTHRRVSREEALRLAPHLKEKNLAGAFLYYDGRTDDSRLTMEVLKSGLDAGAAVANYCKVVALQKKGDKVTGALVRDEISGEEFAIKAKAVINATGVWTDQVISLDEKIMGSRLRPSKGVHLLVPKDRLPVEAALLAPSPTGDGRFIFVVPWQGAVLLGTTDTPFTDDLDRVEHDGSDIRYVLDAANALFPTAQLRESDVLNAIAGLRPLVKADASSTAALARVHKIWISVGGMISIAGGKLTTYRTMAAEAVDVALKRLGQGPIPSKTGELPLGVGRKEALADLVRQYPDLAEPIIPGLPHTKAEVAYAAREEMAVFPEDVLQRRTRLAYLDRGHGEPQKELVAELLKRFQP